MLGPFAHGLQAEAEQGGGGETGGKMLAQGQRYRSPGAVLPKCTHCESISTLELAYRKASLK